MKTRLYKTIAFSFIFLTNVFAFELIKAQNYLKSSDSLLQFYIDPNLMSDSEKSTFIKALSTYAINKSVYDTLFIKPAQNISSVISEYYNFDERKNYESSIVIKKDINFLNSLNENKFLIDTDYISAPKIPMNPTKKSSKKYVQVYDFINNKTFVSTTSLLINNDEINFINNTNKTNAGLWMYKITPNDLKKILDSIPIEMQNKLYGTAFITIDEPKFVEIKFPRTLDTFNKSYFPKKTNSNLNNILTQIHIDNYNLYFVLDFFDESNCSHGKKILDVISQRLKELGLNNIESKIKPIPINYFQNQDSALAFLKRYYSSDKLPYLSKFEGENIINKLKKIKDRNLIDCENCIPEIYIDACMKYYYGVKPDIISTSFYITAYRDIMPNFVNSNTNLITACLNEPGRKIEDLIEKESASDGISNGAIQPLYSAWTTYDKFGSIIVGCQIDSDKYYGMYSSTGKGVTTIGKGIGWGTDESCIKSEDKGSSFATPEIAITLLIAKAFWRSKGFTPNALESRTRLLLCSDLDSAFVGKFASGGPPNLSKLIMISEGFFEDNSGNITECEISDSSFIEYDHNMKKPFMRGYDGISGLTFINDKVYAFIESSFSWKCIEVKNLSITVKTNGNVETFTSIEKLTSNFKQLIKLKNSKT